MRRWKHSVRKSRNHIKTYFITKKKTESGLYIFIPFMLWNKYPNNHVYTLMQTFHTRHWTFSVMFSMNNLTTLKTVKNIKHGIFLNLEILYYKLFTFGKYSEWHMLTKSMLSWVIFTNRNSFRNFVYTVDIPYTLN